MQFLLFWLPFLLMEKTLQNKEKHLYDITLGFTLLKVLMFYFQLPVVMLLQTTPPMTECGPRPPDTKPPLPPSTQHKENSDIPHTHMLDWAPAPGWTAHVSKEGRLYYCK